MEPWSAAAVAAPCSLAGVYSLVGVQATSMLFTLFEGNVSFEIFGTFTVISKSNKKVCIYQTKIVLYTFFDLLRRYVFDVVSYHIIWRQLLFCSHS